MLCHDGSGGSYSPPTRGGWRRLWCPHLTDVAIAHRSVLLCVDVCVCVCVCVPSSARLCHCAAKAVRKSVAASNVKVDVPSFLLSHSRLSSPTHTDTHSLTHTTTTTHKSTTTRTNTHDEGLSRDLGPSAQTGRVRHRVLLSSRNVSKGRLACLCVPGRPIVRLLACVCVCVCVG